MFQIHMWRSETMVLLEMTMQRESAHHTIERLGELGLVEFKDLSSDMHAFQRQHAYQVKRCEELERIIRYFEEEIEKSDIEFAVESTEEDEELEHVDVNVLDTFEQKFAGMEKELRTCQKIFFEQMVVEKNKAEEFNHVIQLCSQFFGEGDETSSGSLTYIGFTLDYMTGVVPREKIATFKLLMYRSTRGNVVPRFAEIPVPLYDHKVGKYIEKDVFTVFFGASAVKEKVKKVCNLPKWKATTHKVQRIPC